MALNNNFYCIAPMMGKTDSFFCYLLGLINKKISVYTEMMHAETIIRSKILESYNFIEDKKKIVVQIAGSKPKRLALAAKKVTEFGFNEININCGCPSNRVVSGKFGISLLLEPKLVRKCVEEIHSKVSNKVSIKTRIGVDEHNSEDILNSFLYELNKAGVNKFIIHARSAITKKLSTKDNLNIPPLNYQRVYKLKKEFNKNEIIINGGFKNINKNNIIKNVDGIMIGREAYKNPWMFNTSMTYNALESKKRIVKTYIRLLENMIIDQYFSKSSLFHIQNIFNGYSGSKKWRHHVSYALADKKLINLLKFLDYDNIKIV